MVLERTLELTIGGTRHQLGPGQVMSIAPGEAHSGRALSPCRVVDVFQPTEWMSSRPSGGRHS